MDIHPVDPSRWHDLQVLFGTRGGAAHCWCQYFAKPDWDFQDVEGNRAALRAHVEHSSLAPGLIAYVDCEPVGWVALGPRATYPRLWHTPISAEPAQHNEGTEPDNAKPSTANSNSLPRAPRPLPSTRGPIPNTPGPLAKPSEPRPESPDLSPRISSSMPAEASVWAITCFVIRVGFRRRGIASELLQAAIEYAREHGATLLYAKPFDTNAEKKAGADLYTGILSSFLKAGFTETERTNRRKVLVQKRIQRISQTPWEAGQSGSDWPQRGCHE